MEALEQRLNDRGTDAEADLEKRLESARKEMTHYKAYDYLIVNDRIEAAVESMEAILVSERGRSFRYEGNLLEQLK
jgi:guanylate kinase